MSDGNFFSNEDDALYHAWEDPVGDEGDDNEGDASAAAPEARLPPGIVESAIERCEEYLLEGDRRRAGDELLLAIRSLQRISLTRVRDTVVGELKAQLGTLMGCHRGLSCDLYFLETDREGAEFLRPRISLGGLKRNPEPLPVCGDSIQASAIRNFSPEYWQDGTCVAIPLVGGIANNTPLGVLVMQFIPGDAAGSGDTKVNASIKKLEIDAKILSVHMICYNNLKVGSDSPCLWSPASHGWSFNGYLMDLCHTVVEAQEALDKTASYSCSIWNVDADKETLWVRATSGYDYEYLSRGLGIWNSYTTRVARQTEGMPYIGQPPDEFVSKRKGELAGLTTVASVPLYLNPSDADLDLEHVDLMSVLSVPDVTGESRCFQIVNGGHRTAVIAELVFHLYRFAGWGRQDDLSTLPDESTMTEISVMVEESLMAFERVRKQAALAFLEATMQAARKEWQAGSRVNSHARLNVMYHALKEVLVTCLNAGGCSIFRYERSAQSERSDDLGQLALVSTTGVTDYNGTRTSMSEQQGSLPFYDLNNKNHQGLMFYVLQHPEEGVLRLHSIENPGDLPTGCERVVRQHLEDLSPDTADRRFMGVAIAIDGNVELVIRVVRPSSQSPFSKQDEELFADMAYHCVVRNLWRGSDEELQKALKERGSADASSDESSDPQGYEEGEQVCQEQACQEEPTS